jgi:hypothetical protein
MFTGVRLFALGGRFGLMMSVPFIIAGWKLQW